MTGAVRAAVLCAICAGFTARSARAQSTVESSRADRALEYVLFAARGSLASFQIVAAPGFRLVSRAQHRVRPFDPRRITDATWRQWLVPVLAHLPPFENGEVFECSAARHRCEFHDAAGSLTIYRFTEGTQARLLEVSIATEAGE